MKNILFWILFLTFSFVVDAQNIALNKPTASSSNENTTLISNKVNDGNLDTRWASVHLNDPQWISVDLEQQRVIDRVVIHWEAAYATHYTIQVSNNNSSWTTVYSENNGNGGEDNITFPAQTAQYIRVYGSQRATQYGYSIWEFQIYGQASEDDASLSSISINNTPLNGFSPQTTSYVHRLVVGDSEVPTITASTSNPNATYTIYDAADLTETTTIVVTSADGTQSMTYSITFQQSNYALIWSDEFNNDGTVYIENQVNAIDSQKWFHQTFPPNNGGWFNAEEQHYTDNIENSYVSDGSLKIKAIKEYYDPSNGSPKNYTSARLNSKFAFRYGRMEVRAKLPVEQGTWPAFWTLGKNISEQGAYWQTQGYGDTAWPSCGEIDIMEQDHDKTRTSGAFHFGPDYTQHQYTTDNILVSNSSTTWHVYAMEWTAETIYLMVDDVVFHTLDNANNPYFDNEHFILLNIAMGGSLGGSIPSNFSTSTMEIDYVRVYQVQPLSIKQITQPEIVLFPNPTSNEFTVYAPSRIQEVVIYDLQGRKLISEHSNQSKFTVQNNLGQGVYLVDIKGRDFHEVKHLIVK